MHTLLSSVTSCALFALALSRPSTAAPVITTAPASPTQETCGCDDDEDHRDRASDHDDREWGAGLDLDSTSRFVWRGLALSDGPAVQPSVWASAFGLTASAWGSALITNEDDRRLGVVNAIGGVTHDVAVADR